MVDVNSLGNVEALLGRLTRGDKRALAQMLTLVEDGGQDLPEIEELLSSHCGHARVVGFTGPPGAGKSTLVDRYLGEVRSRGRSVAALLIDPSSPILMRPLTSTSTRSQRAAARWPTSSVARGRTLRR